jgi:hypothetical protein
MALEIHHQVRQEVGPHPIANELVTSGKLESLGL